MSLSLYNSEMSVRKFPVLKEYSTACCARKRFIQYVQLELKDINEKFINVIQSKQMLYNFKSQVDVYDRSKSIICFLTELNYKYIKC